MKEKIEKFEQKYRAQKRLLDSWLLRDLNERTLHDVIKAMLINTSKDCVKFECAMDPEMECISFIAPKEDKTPEDAKKLKHAQERLRMSIHLAKVSENALGELLDEMFLSDEIKSVFRQDIPELYENLYYVIDIENDIIDNIVFSISDCYEINYKQICAIINGCIIDMVENVEEYIEGIQERDLYKDFVKYRDEWRKNRKEKADE